MKEYLQIGDAAALLDVSLQTLRNWDQSGKLRARRHPINGYRLYRLAEIHEILKGISEFPPAEVEQDQLELFSGVRPQPAPENGADELPECHWSLTVALDPKHRPQYWCSPSTTVRRDWRKFPQEAHVIDESRTKYRRFSVEEIAILQGFNPKLVERNDLTERQRIAALGDAVPPPLAKALVGTIDERQEWQNRTALEICAGMGGLAEGATAAGLDHLALIDRSEVCVKLLKAERGWPPDRVQLSDVMDIDYQPFRGKVGLLSGGPPCQPWSLSGLHKGETDPRDLMGRLPEIVSAVVPEVFLFENVPGLASSSNSHYLKDLVDRLSRPAADVKYGVLGAILNTADFGLPQVRRRLFLLGIRDAPAAEASRCFDAVSLRRTHRQPSASGTLSPWRTIGEALNGRETTTLWRRWILAPSNNHNPAT